MNKCLENADQTVLVLPQNFHRNLATFSIYAVDSSSAQSIDQIGSQSEWDLFGYVEGPPLTRLHVSTPDRRTAELLWTDLFEKTVEIDM